MTHSPVSTKQSWCEHFPLTKIKSVLQAQEEVGQLREPVVRLVSAASALFIRDLVKKAQSADGNVITLVDLKRVVQGSEQYSAILNGVSENVVDVDDSSPYQAKKAKVSPKRDSSSSNLPVSNDKRIKPDNLIQEAMNHLGDQNNIAQERQSNAELLIDDDDYD